DCSLAAGSLMRQQPFLQTDHVNMRELQALRRVQGNQCYARFPLNRLLLLAVALESQSIDEVSQSLLARGALETAEILEQVQDSFLASFGLFRCARGAPQVGDISAFVEIRSGHRAAIRQRRKHPFGEALELGQKFRDSGARFSRKRAGEIRIRERAVQIDLPL